MISFRDRRDTLCCKDISYRRKTAAAGHRKLHCGKAKSTMDRNCKGFTLMELLIVIAIIAVLAAVAIPTFSAHLEKSREATDLANVRSAYAQVSAETMLGNADAVTVALKQKKADWQSVDPVNIGGIVHTRGQADTDNWKGVAQPGGSCVVSYDENCGVVLTWSGAVSPSGPDYPFDTSIKDYFPPLLYATDFWKANMLAENGNFELDSRCPSSSFIPDIKVQLAKLNGSLLQLGDCTWAFLGNGYAGQSAKRYLFWTSLNTDKVGPEKQIPVLIQTGDGKYYVSETTTGQRTDKNGDNYVAVSKKLFANQYTDQYKKVLDAGTEYPTLEEAYEAYRTALNREEYDEVRKSSGQ